MSKSEATRLIGVSLTFLAAILGAAQPNGRVSVHRVNGQRWNTTGPFPVFQNGKIGYIDVSGKLVISAQFERIEECLFSEGLASVSMGAGSFGYIDNVGKFVIAPRKFRRAGPFVGGVAAVENEAGGCGYIDTTGSPLRTPPLAECSEFSEGLAAVRVEPGGWGYIGKSGKMEIAPQFETAYGFSEGLAAVRIAGRTGYIDHVGKLLINPRFDLTPAGAGGNFSEGLATVWLSGPGNVPSQASVIQLAGVIDTTGKMVVPPRWSMVDAFSESLALVRGEQGAPPKAGYIDKSGKLVIPLQFVVADFFSHGLAPASVDGRLWGYIDRTGNFAISPQFDYAFPFFPAGIAWVKLGNAFGYIDTHGRYIWNPQK